MGEVEKRDERWSEVELLLIVGATENREMYVYKSTVESGVANAAFRAILLAAQSHAVPAEGKAPVSAVYPFSPVKANVSRLCEKLKIGMKSGWG